MAEKRWNSRINTWLRGPAMVYYTVLAYWAWLSGNHTMPTVFLIVSAALHFHNGQVRHTRIHTHTVCFPFLHTCYRSTTTVRPTSTMATDWPKRSASRQANDLLARQRSSEKLHVFFIAQRRQ